MRRRALAPALVAAAGVLAACGGGSTDTSVDAIASSLAESGGLDDTEAACVAEQMKANLDDDQIVVLMEADDEADAAAVGETAVEDFAGWVVDCALGGPEDGAATEAETAETADPAPVAGDPGDVPIACDAVDAAQLSATLGFDLGDGVASDVAGGDIASECTWTNDNADQVVATIYTAKSSEAVSFTLDDQYEFLTGLLDGAAEVDGVGTRALAGEFSRDEIAVLRTVVVQTQSLVLDLSITTDAGGDDEASDAELADIARTIVG
jgi:hypothetical protein